MSRLANYFTNGNALGVFDLNFNVNGLTLQGSSVVFTGDEDVNQVYVGSGVTVDFTQSDGNADVVYVNKRFDQYTLAVPANGNQLVLTSSDGATITVAGAGLPSDKIVFLDGQATTKALFDYQRALQADPQNPPVRPWLDDKVTSQEVSAKLGSTLIGDQSNKTVTGFAVDEDGVVFGTVREGAKLVVNGTESEEKVYVTAGSQLDATLLSGGVDEIYVTGRLQDYEKTISGNSNLVQLKRTIGGHDEIVTVAKGDTIIFANGSVSTGDLFNSIKNGTTPTLIPTLTTPGVPLVTEIKLSGGSGAADGVHYNAGDTITATVKFSEAVYGDISRGLPTLKLSVGSASVDATYESGINNPDGLLTFSYTVLATHNDTDGVSFDSNALALNNPTLRALTGAYAIPDFGSVGLNDQFIVDNTAPGQPTIGSVKNDAGTTIAPNGNTDDTTPTISGTAEKGSTVTVFDGTKALGPATMDGNGNWTFTAPTLDPGSHSVTAKATDAAGNTGDASTASVFSIAAQFPTSIALDGTLNGVNYSNWDLLKPVSVANRVYYVVDTTTEATPAHNSLDTVNHGDLDAVFNNKSDTTDTARTAVLGTDNGGQVRVMLPTIGSTAALDITKSYPAGSYAEIWDQLATATNPSGLPSGWSGSDVYWSATKASFSTDKHYTATMDNSNSAVLASDTDTNFFALQVLDMITSPSAVSVQENSPLKYSAQGFSTTGALTWSLGDAGVGDNGLFTINASTGAVSFDAIKLPDGANYEDPNNSDHAYSITIVATNSASQTLSQNLTIAVEDVVEAKPVFTSGDKVSVFESVGTGLVYDAQASDTPGGTYSLDGKDGGLFSINAVTGEISFKAAPNVDGAQDYRVTVTAKNDFGSTDKGVTITVVDSAIDLNGTLNNVSYSSWDLIAPINVSGRLYYVVDTSTFGATHDTSDVVNHNTLDQLFRGGTGTLDTTDDVNGVNTRTAVLSTANGGLVRVMLPTMGSTVALSTTNSPDYPQGSYAEIWDQVATAAGTTNGLPTGWGDSATSTSASSSFWSASAGTTAGNHYAAELDTTTVSSKSDSNSYYFALQVLDRITSGNKVSVDENTTAAAYTATGFTPVGNGTLTWSLAGLGVDNALFTINSSTGEVFFNARPNFESAADSDKNNVYKITVRGTNSDNGYLDQSVAVTVTDVDEIAPYITGVALTSAVGAKNNYLNAGDVITATATFSEVVNVTDTEPGAPSFKLDIGGSLVDATYASGSGTNKLAFTYTILSGQTDTDGISIPAGTVAPGGESITDPTGNIASLNYSAALANGSYMVDTTAGAGVSSLHVTPNDDGWITIAESSTLNATLYGKAGANELVTITSSSGDFSTVVTDLKADVWGNYSYTLNGLQLNRIDSGSSWGSLTFTATSTDLAGNAGEALARVIAVNQADPIYLAYAPGGVSHAVSPILNRGNVYYMWDTDPNSQYGTFSQGVNHDTLDSIFNGGVDTTSSTNSPISLAYSGNIYARFRLPTQAELQNLFSDGSDQFFSDWGYRSTQSFWTSTAGVTAGTHVAVKLGDSYGQAATAYADASTLADNMAPLGAIFVAM